MQKLQVGLTRLLLLCLFSNIKTLARRGSTPRLVTTMKGYKNIVGILLAAGLLAGCSRDAEPTMQQEIAVTSGVTGMQKRIRSINNNTTLQTKDIKIDAYYADTETKLLDGVKLHYNTDEWVFWNGSAQVHYYWPFEGSKTGSGDDASTLDFVGFCPYDAPAYITGSDYDAEDGASFTCDISSYMTHTAQADMQEYVMAVLPDQTYAIQAAAPGGALPMVFKHPFALVKFVLASGSGTHVTVDSIAIAGLYTGGTFTYDGTTMNWAGTGSASLEIKGLSLHTEGTTETVQMLVIPKNYGAKTLSVRGTWDDWSDVAKHTISADVDMNWQPGYSYTYNLTVSKYALTVDGTQFTEQW